MIGDQVKSLLSGPSVDFTQIFNVLQNVVQAINTLQQTIGKIFPLGVTSSAAWNPPSLTNGTQATTTVTVAGATTGMSAQAAFSLDLQGLILYAYVSAANTVTVVLANFTGGTIDLGSGIVTVWVRAN